MKECAWGHHTSGIETASCHRPCCRSCRHSHAVAQEDTQMLKHEGRRYQCVKEGQSPVLAALQRRSRCSHATKSAALGAGATGSFRSDILRATEAATHTTRSSSQVSSPRSQLSGLRKSSSSSCQLQSRLKGARPQQALSRPRLRKVSYWFLSDILYHKKKQCDLLPRRPR